MDPYSANVVASLLGEASYLEYIELLPSGWNIDCLERERGEA